MLRSHKTKVRWSLGDFSQCAIAITKATMYEANSLIQNVQGGGGDLIIHQISL